MNISTLRLNAQTQTTATSQSTRRRKGNIGIDPFVNSLYSYLYLSTYLPTCPLPPPLPIPRSLINYQPTYLPLPVWLSTWESTTVGFAFLISAKHALTHIGEHMWHARVGGLHCCTRDALANVRWLPIIYADTELFFHLCVRRNIIGLFYWLYYYYYSASSCVNGLIPGYMVHDGLMKRQPPIYPVNLFPLPHIPTHRVTKHTTDI